MTDRTNWAGNLRYRAHAIHQPRSVDQLQDLVARLPRVKALGTRHSFSEVADTEGGDLVSLSGLSSRIEVDADAMAASVSPATTYGEFARALDELGFGLENMGSLPHISVGGATATGTHGSGDANHVLSASISAIDLVRADGSMTTIDRTNPDLLALAVGLGGFGVIARLSMDVRPSFVMRQDVSTGVRWDAALGSFDEIMASAYSVSFIGDFGDRSIDEIIQKSVVQPDASSAPPIPPGGRPEHGTDGTVDDAHTVRGGHPGPWFERLPHFRPDRPPSAGGDELQSEYFVAREHGVAALEAMLSMGDRISPHLHAAEIRTVAADDLWASPAHERACVCIGFTWKQHHDEVMALLPVIEAGLEEFVPRPHWGKLFTLRDLQSRFPKLGAYMELRDRYDPSGKFASPFLTRLR